MAHDFDAPVRVVTVDSCEDFVMGQAVALLDREALGSPCSLDGVVVLIVADGDGVVYDVPDGLDLGLESGLLLGCLLCEALLLLLEFDFALQQVGDIFLGLSTG